MLTTSTFSAITSIDDVRLVTLIGVAINTIESLAIEEDSDPEAILARELYLTNKHINNVGTACYLHKLTSHYPILKAAIE
jgi:uncharacterized membrane protein